MHYRQLDRAKVIGWAVTSTPAQLPRAMPQTAANALLAGKLADAPVIGVGHVEHRARGQHDEAHAATKE